MTDIRRTLLWVVFSVSLFLLWDAWNKHNGQPSFFGPPPAATAGRDGAGAGAGRRRRRRRCRCRAAAATPAPAPPRRRAGVGAGGAGGGERVTVTTDVVKATLDSARRLTLVRVELLQAASTRSSRSQARRAARPVARSALYLAQTGLVRRPAAAACRTTTRR